MVVLISFLCFNLMYYNHSIIMKYKSYFKQLPIFNKIFVSNSLSKFSVAFFIFLIVIIFNVFVPFILLYIIFWVIVLESYFFAIFYENNISFRKFINNKLFNKDDKLTKEYFSFFF